MTQLDLFRDSSPESPKPSAILRPFPLARRRQLITATAAHLTAHRGTKARQLFWDRTIADLRKLLREFEVGMAEIDGQLLAFHHAVSMEMTAQYLTSGLQRPGGAA